ncbi:MAG: UvrD-helicase domain-containing protein, partial [Candidatus Muiribacteriota bacterium]
MKIFNVETAELSGVNLIEASAGTGKTYNIAGIYHRLVVEKEMKPSEILVVTFTEAATSELKDRILVKLNEEYDKIKKEDNNIKNRLNLKLAINSFDEASIFTIHGFCKKVLNENAFEAESMFNFSIEKNGETIISSLVKDYWRQFFMPETPEYLEMLEQSGLNENSMISLVKEAVENPKSKIIPEYREIPEKEMFDSYNKFIEKFKTVKNIFKDEKENIYRIYCNGKIHAGKVKSDNAMEKIQKIEQFFVSGDFEMLNGKDLNAASWEYLTNNIKINVEPEKDFYNIFFVEFDKLKEEHQQSIKKINEHFSWHKHNIVKYVKNKIDFEREKRNISTFSDLIRDVWNAVEKSQNKNQNGLVDIINKKYKAVLIDEFQDTDSVQYDIFNKLFFESGKISFMIGDPKQSIYKFRGADIYSYIQAGEKAENKYTLENNYRSCPELVESVNYIFSLNPNPFKNQKIKFIKAGSKSDKVKFENQKSMEIIYVKEKSNNKDKYQDIIAEHNALEILKLLDENSNITPENIAILVRTNEQGEIIKSKLQKYGIPSVTYSETDVFETEEAEHLIKILKAAAEPLNISNLGNALCTFYIGKNHNELRKILDSENDAELVLFQEKFTLIQNCFNSFGISRAVNLFDSQFEVYQNLLQYDDFERKVTNYRHLIELIQEYSIKGRKSLENIIKWMIDRKNLKLSSEESEEKELRLESDEKAVKVITMHKSKGLQFETVFCPFFFAPASNSKAEHFKYNDTEKPGNTLINLEKIGKEMVEIEEDEENMRLFYVTLTRAVKKCVVYFPDHKDSFKTPLGYLLGLEPESDWVTDFEKAFKSNPNIDFKIIDENFE